MVVNEVQPGTVVWICQEVDERNVCEAFLDGIPDEIAYGGNKHLKPLPEQKNDIVFEKEKE